MRNGFLSLTRIVLPCAAILSLGCQSPWQSGAPAASGGGWFSWMGVSERSSDPLTRLAGGGAYSPGDAEADASAQGSRQQLYGARTSELDLSRSAAQTPAGAPNPAVAAQAAKPKTLDDALPAPEDDVAARFARALQSRQTGAATPALATGPNPAEGYDGAVAPAGYQAPATTGATSAPSTQLAPRTYAGAAPTDAEANPFFDPFGEGSRSAASGGSQTTGSISATFAPPPSTSGTGGSSLRLLTTPQASEPTTPTLTYPSESTSAAPTGSLLRLLGDNPLRKDAPVAP